MKRSFAAMVLCLLAAVPAWAQPPQDGGFPGRGEQAGPAGPDRLGPPPNLIFEAIDADGDGVITTREMRKAVAALKSLDADGDGNLTLEEVAPRGGPGGPGGDPAAFIDNIFRNDQDGDGLLAAGEVSERLAPMLMGADTNNDGKFDRAEVTAAMQNARGRFGGPGGGNFDSQQMTQQLMQGDINGDGVLTPNEVPRQAMGMLRGADQNGDGAIDQQELQAASQRMNNRFSRGYGAGREQFRQPPQQQP